MARAVPDVLVVAYGAPELLVVALAGLSPEFRVVVVDNSLSEDVREAAEQQGGEYVRPSENLGFAAGVNAGLAQLSGDRDVLLLNPDARLSPEGVLCLHEHLAEGVAAVAPKLRRPSGEIERTRWPMPSPAAPWLGAVGLSDAFPRRPSFLSGAVLLLSRRALDEVGGFDERYFLYAEETDWQQRALRAGWTLREAAEVEAVHWGGATSTDPELRERRFHQSAELFIRKWYGTWGWGVFRVGSLLSAGRRWLTAPTPEQRAQAGLTFRLYLQGLARGLPS